MNQSILIIGGGNMGGAIARALHAAPEFSVNVVEADAARRDALSVAGIPAFARLADAPQMDSYLLAIKPQQFAEYVVEMKAALHDSAPLIISIMAGISLAALQKISPRAVRVMPNLPAVIHESMSVLCAPKLDVASRVFAEKVFSSVGEILWVEDEHQMHAVTAISGSGPGFVFAFMEALEGAALALGLNAEQCQKLVAQTFRGASLLAAQSPENVSTLRAQVTSKGGTTEAGLTVLSQADVARQILLAARAAAARSEALGN